MIGWTSVSNTIIRDRMSPGESDVIFWNIFLVYKVYFIFHLLNPLLFLTFSIQQGILGFICAFLCFRMRFKFKEYLEIQQIAYCVSSLDMFSLLFIDPKRALYSRNFISVFVGFHSYCKREIFGIVYGCTVYIGYHYHEHSFVGHVCAFAKENILIVYYYVISDSILTAL